MSSVAASNTKPAGRKNAKATPVASAAPSAAPATSAAPAPAPAPAPSHAPLAPVAAPVVNTVETHDEVNLTSRVTALAEKVNNLRSVMATIYSEVKVLEKAVPRELKKAQKGGRRARKAAAATEGGEVKPKKETVFTKPTAISDALCTFLGVAKGTLISRSEVTSRVCKYAKDKGLMEKKAIKADAALRKLLALKEGDELQILNLQRYLKIHYPAKATATA